MSTTRFNSAGLSGRKQTDINISDPALKQRNVRLPIVANTNATDIPLIDVVGGGQVISAFIKVNTAEATGTSPTVSVGINGGSATAILPATSVAATGNFGAPVMANLASNSTLTYTLSGANFAEMDAELVIFYVDLEG